MADSLSEPSTKTNNLESTYQFSLSSDIFSDAAKIAAISSIHKGTGNKNSIRSTSIPSLFLQMVKRVSKIYPLLSLKWKQCMRINNMWSGFEEIVSGFWRNNFLKVSYLEK